jgi:hypothetical protein
MRPPIKLDVVAHACHPAYEGGIIQGRIIPAMRKVDSGQAGPGKNLRPNLKNS